MASHGNMQIADDEDENHVDSGNSLVIVDVAARPKTSEKGAVSGQAGQLADSGRRLGDCMMGDLIH